jgi:hypothetical protein
VRSLSRQPAKVVGDRFVSHSAALRRADARHRRGRQGGDLPAAARARGRGCQHPAGKLRVAGDPGHGRPCAGAAGRAPRGGAGREPRPPSASPSSAAAAGRGRCSLAGGAAAASFVHMGRRARQAAATSASERCWWR